MRFPEYIKSYILDFLWQNAFGNQQFMGKNISSHSLYRKRVTSSLNGYGDLFFPSMERRNCHIRSTYCLLLQSILSLFASGKGFIGTLF